MQMSKAERRTWEERGYSAYNGTVEMDPRSQKCWAITNATMIWMMMSRRFRRNRRRILLNRWSVVSVQLRPRIRQGSRQGRHVCLLHMLTT